jgi:hypothetical protein
VTAIRGSESLWLPRGTAAAFERRMTPEPERRLPADPVEFATEGGVHLWSKQREIARSVQRNRATYVPSCHSAGKTFLAATIGAWWIAGAPPGERWLVTTAPTERAVRELLWRELSRAHGRYDLPGTISGTSWSIGPAGGRTPVGTGFKPQDLVDEEQARQRFAGYHASEGVLVILDEATGIPPWLWIAVDQITTNEMDRVLAIGNPDDPSSEFAKRCDASTGSTRAAGQRYDTKHATVIPIDAYATPNLTGEAVPEYVRKSLIARSTVERWRDEWGETNPLYVSKVRGLFPDRSSRNVIGPALIRQAWALELPGTDAGCYGLDVSRSALGDENAFYRDRGGVIREVSTWRNPDLMESAAHVLRLTYQSLAVPIAVDTDGIGGAMFDMLRRGLHSIRGLPVEAEPHRRNVIPFSVNMAARQPRDFDGRRSEVWWGARGELEAGMWDLDEGDDELAAQLMAPRWWIDGRGRIHVETKDELAKRGIHSPDRADSAIIARLGAPRKVHAPSSGHRNGRALRGPADGVRTVPL